MTPSLSLFNWAEARPVAAPKAPEGVKRAARAGGRADPAVLTVAARHIGVEIPKTQLWSEVNALVLVECDTPRRRLDALAAEGLVTLGEPSKLGHVLVLWVRP
jgi:hypothetical protein